MTDLNNHWLTDLRNLDLRRNECSNIHRGPEGPNEDIAVCNYCGLLTFSMRPKGETFGDHFPDCSLPRDHQSYCEGGGKGHPRAESIRG